LTQPTATNKIVFVTHDDLEGSLGGLTGADAKCQAEADDENLAGTYKAWLSGVTTSASDRLAHNAGPYVLVDGTKVADSWADFIDGTLTNPINKSADGNSVSAGTYVWTGSTAAGDNNADTKHCTAAMTGEGWTISHTYNGTSTRVGNTMSVYYAVNCGQNSRLYCMEQ
jgi:hypothetical protein